MTATRCLAVSAVLLVVATSDASAQTRVVRSGDDRLTGVAEVDVLIQNSAAPMGCPVTPERLGAEAVETLRRAGIRATQSEKARSWHYSIVVTIQSARTASDCATAVAAELVAAVTGLPDADRENPPDRWGSMLIGFMPLVRESALVIGAPVEHDAAVRRMTVAHVTAIAARIRSANP
jgi:hypothetical protein